MKKAAKTHVSAAFFWNVVRIPAFKYRSPAGDLQLFLDIFKYIDHQLLEGQASEQCPIRIFFKAERFLVCIHIDIGREYCPQEFLHSVQLPVSDPAQEQQYSENKLQQAGKVGDECLKGYEAGNNAGKFPGFQEVGDSCN